jgi:leader peptidase (prepilin peptidase)/N-methyltransferase
MIRAEKLSKVFHLPRGRSVVWPGSHCFCCGTELTPRDLVPVLSYLLSGRRCR